MISVLRHKDYRRLWLSQVVSQLGDWLSRMAVLALIESLAGRKEAAVALGLMFAQELAARMAPTALVAPIAGPIADRLPRRTLMVVADLLRGLVVLGLCFVDQPSELPWLYAVVVLQMGIAPFFESARSASVPNLVPQEELTDAHALSSATWSTMLAFGSALGGLIVGWVGMTGAFILDAVTYVVSALLLIGLRLPPPPKHPRPLAVVDLFLARDLRDAWRHARSHRLGPVLTVKWSWGMAGGLLVCLSLLGAERFAAAGKAQAIGWLFAARGVGTGVGPLIARRLGQADRQYAKSIAVSFPIAAAGYACVPLAPDLFTACLFVAVAHTGGSTIWVFSTVLWQRRVEDTFRGRVHALEFQGMTLAFVVWGFVTGLVYDATGSVATALWITAGAAAVAGPLWWCVAGHRIGAGVDAQSSGRPSPS